MIDIENKLAKDILSDITVHMKYAKYLPGKQRRENWNEIVTRNMEMHIEKFPLLKNEIEHYYKWVFDKKVLPSMRGLQFAGKAVDINQARQYNCSFLHMDDYKAFSELCFLLLSGCGVGYSVQNAHVNKLPEIKMTKKSRKFVVDDSIQGWAEAINVLVKAYFLGKAKPQFDFRQIRPKGALLVTSGGKAPGHEPLKECLFQIEKIFDRKNVGDKLSTLEVHDICCYIADAVLAGGIRRAALISLFNFDDEEMLTCKFGNWWEENPQRGRANNSAVILRHKVKKDDFISLWKKIEASGSGEPGFFFTNNADWGLNPCAEISLRTNQFCNLTTINADSIESQQDFEERAEAAAFIGTLQAAYTDFFYLREIWKETTEKEALLGVSMTGVASLNVEDYDFDKITKLIKSTNKKFAKELGINPAARITSIKPEGTTSLVLGTSSGVHAWHSAYYIRRVRIGKNESLFTYLSIYHPEILEDEFFKPTQQSVISIPQHAPSGAILRENETALEMLERVKSLHDMWIKPGHVKGDNTNNVSATVTIKPDEWEATGEWLWRNKNSYTALSFLPFSEHSYVQAPFEECTKEKYDSLVKTLHSINLDNVVEVSDETYLKDNLACAGGQCEV
jgi:ribonucleoside-triphosphate reductase